MDFKAIVSPVAKANIREAVAYYKKKVSVRVAQNFLKDYEFALQKILQNPFYQIYYKNFRGFRLKKYPYIIFYQVDEDQKNVIVKAVFHAKQDADKRPL